MSLQYDPEFLEHAAPILKMLEGAAKLPAHDVATRRAYFSSFTRQMLPLPDNIEKIVHHVPASDGHNIPVIHIRTKGRETSANGERAIVHVHGGGYFLLSADECSPPLVNAVAQTGVQILSIDYRLAPENPYPIPFNDCWSALQWVYANVEDLNIDPKRIAVMGESAGGGLAAAMTIKARDISLTPPIAKQILVYPMIDDRTTTNHAGKMAFWSEADNITGWTAYLGADRGTDKVEPYAAAARVESVEGLPPLYLDTAQLDIFVHEDLEYVRRFVAANIPVDCHIYPGMPHGFEALAAGASVTKRAYENRYKAMTSF
ncbi:hypothetical protein N7532_003057 [Penicillium argentinense]|uniref:Alpha/beta hydrolase fold-3 domain-containing protein n=1 Tax=Penicillium argentinense TaxID=1131581 RepID=A0A9W9FLU6_9EURO|nr:uncharacterized protein N7532_003057 [Penicillium argentinense]KAJ5102528.1 hypothetical protein N7532_003057 [Penicillium argentinense]